MPEPIPTPWNVVEADFPATGSPVEQLHFLLNYAVLAPSRHNAQPWLFHVQGNAVELFADRSRALPVTDPDGREMIISCGAALANLLIAVQHFGYAAIVEFYSTSDKPDLLAHITLAKGGVATEEGQTLFHAILQRRTNRQLFKERSVPKSLLSDFEDIAGREGTIFQVVQGEEARYTLASLIATGD